MVSYFINQFNISQKKVYRKILVSKWHFEAKQMEKIKQKVDFINSSHLFNWDVWNCGKDDLELGSLKEQF